jgi:hypothetical protein
LISFLSELQWTLVVDDEQLWFKKKKKKKDSKRDAFKSIKIAFSLLAREGKYYFFSRNIASNPL